MAVINLQRARVYGTVSGNSPQVKYFPEADEQEFKAGQFVYLVGGRVTVCPSNPTAVLGMAISDATGPNSSIPVHVINGDTEFEMNVYYDGDGDADDQIDIEHVTGVYGMAVVDGKCYVDISNTTDLVFIVKGISVRDNDGDTYGRAVVDVIPTVAQLMSARPDTHVHAATDITSGTLSTDRFSAYADLTAESKIGSGENQVSQGDHTHT